MPRDVQSNTHPEDWHQRARAAADFLGLREVRRFGPRNLPGESLVGASVPT